MNVPFAAVKGAVTPVRYFGIDPGSHITGYGLIEADANRIRWLASGVIATAQGAPLEQRIEVIYDTMCERLREAGPCTVCIEEAFYAKNVHTTLVLGHARGVVMLAARKAGYTIQEYSPREIKKSVVGNGNATKEQVGFMIRTLLSPPAGSDQVDACDALAAALCGFHGRRTLAVLHQAQQSESPKRKRHV